MPKLEHLALYANMLRGSIPSAIGHAKRLKSLLIGNNLFFGKLVTEIGKVTTLEKLTMGFNEFWRTIPTELGLLTNLKQIETDQAFQLEAEGGVLIAPVWGSGPKPPCSPTVAGCPSLIMIVPIVQADGEPDRHKTA